MKCPKCTGEMNQLFTSWYCNYCDQRSKQQRFPIPTEPHPLEQQMRVYKDHSAPGGLRYGYVGHVNDPNDSGGTSPDFGANKPTTQTTQYKTLSVVFGEMMDKGSYNSLFPQWKIIRRSPVGGILDGHCTLGIRRRDKDTNVLWGAWGYWDVSLFFTDEERDHLSLLTQTAQPLAEGVVGPPGWREEYVKCLVEKCNPNRFAVSLGRAAAALCNTIEEEALKK